MGPCVVVVHLLFPMDVSALPVGVLVFQGALTLHLYQVLQLLHPEGA